jgi:hypothetical protein
MNRCYTIVLNRNLVGVSDLSQLLVYIQCVNNVNEDRPTPANKPKRVIQGQGTGHPLTVGVIKYTPHTSPHRGFLIEESP